MIHAYKKANNFNFNFKSCLVTLCQKNKKSISYQGGPQNIPTVFELVDYLNTNQEFRNNYNDIDYDVVILAAFNRLSEFENSANPKEHLRLDDDLALSIHRIDKSHLHLDTTPKTNYVIDFFQSSNNARLVDDLVIKRAFALYLRIKTDGVFKVYRDSGATARLHFGTGHWS